MTVDAMLLRAPRDIDPNRVAPGVEAMLTASHVARGVAISYGESFAVHTRGAALTFFDCTDLACSVVRRSSVLQGHLVTATAHTTCGLIVQENEPLLLADLCDRLRRFAAPDELYRHNEMDVRTINVCGLDECANGHSHCQHALLGGGVVLPVREGELILGRWQRLLLVELDHPRHREFTIQVTGVASA